jgi:hypothetical protein
MEWAWPSGGEFLRARPSNPRLASPNSMINIESIPRDTGGLGSRSGEDLDEGGVAE